MTGSPLPKPSTIPPTTNQHYYCKENVKLQKAIICSNKPKKRKKEEEEEEKYWDVHY